MLTSRVRTPSEKCAMATKQLVRFVGESLLGDTGFPVEPVVNELMRNAGNRR
jgi:hypothetical protein